MGKLAFLSLFIVEGRVEVFIFFLVAMLRRHTTKNDRRTNINRVYHNTLAVYNKPFTAQTLSHSLIQGKDIFDNKTFAKKIVARGTEYYHTIVACLQCQKLNLNFRPQ